MAVSMSAAITLDVLINACLHLPKKYETYGMPRDTSLPFSFFDLRVSELND